MPESRAVCSGGIQRLPAAGLRDAWRRPRHRTASPAVRSRCGPAAALRELAEERRHFGGRRLHILLRHEGLVLNHTRTERICRQEGLAMSLRPVFCSFWLLFDIWTRSGIWSGFGA
ncbi:IS3 family transposase [uncultured Desulfovibrio sp.]|uniref:IS3 family transposase n=1 Tax=uncultured Desulfovibrio sp. TaxID=167968 RepID=UPI0035A6A803